MNIYLISRPQLISQEVHKFLHDEGFTWDIPTTTGDILPEIAGRLCYLSYGKGRKTNKEWMEHILEVGHGSVLEHAQWTFLITGISRSCSHEIVRHRAGFAYSQVSQRYVDESEAKMIAPVALSDGPGYALSTWYDSAEIALKAYRAVSSAMESEFKDEPDPTQRRKLARQAARSVLPNATETKLCMSANARALRHFIEVRGTKFADPEIRAVAVGMLKIMQFEAPNIFADMQVGEDGTISARYHKV